MGIDCNMQRKTFAEKIKGLEVKVGLQKIVCLESLCDEWKTKRMVHCNKQYPYVKTIGNNVYIYDLCIKKIEDCYK